MEIDHYVVLGLPSGEQGAKLSDAAIIKAYKTKALELHPDKRPNETKRKRFDDLLSLRFRRQRQLSQHASRKRRKMATDFHERERASDLNRLFDETERLCKKMNEELEKIMKFYKSKGT
ncbi:hypothetical protein MKX01_021444 [Papaver californicum]|nr:hypothetical protein MKX01_021444 [Papaver californicum]